MTVLTHNKPTEDVLYWLLSNPKHDKSCYLICTTIESTKQSMYLYQYFSFYIESVLHSPENLDEETINFIINQIEHVLCHVDWQLLAEHYRKRTVPASWKASEAATSPPHIHLQEQRI